MTELGERRGIESSVYQPAEDSHQLAETAIEALEGPNRVLEVGSGSGYVATMVRQETVSDVVATDFNPHACRATRAYPLETTGSEAPLQTVQTDLVSGFQAESFDAVLFNPPYLPENPNGKREDWMERALTGGETGRVVIERFLDAVGRVLAPDGVVFLLFSSVTGIEEVCASAADNGFEATELSSRSFPYETLVVYRFEPPRE